MSPHSIARCPRRAAYRRQTSGRRNVCWEAVAAVRNDPERKLPKESACLHRGLLASLSGGLAESEKKSGGAGFFLASAPASCCPAIAAPALRGSACIWKSIIATARIITLHLSYRERTRCGERMEESIGAKQTVPSYDSEQYLQGRRQVIDSA